MSCPKPPSAQSLPLPGLRVLCRLELRRPVEPFLIRCHSLGSARFRSLYLRTYILLYTPLASEMFPGY